MEGWGHPVTLTFPLTPASSPSLWRIITHRMGKKAILSVRSHKTAHRQTHNLAVGPQQLFHISNWKMSATSSCDGMLGKPSGKLIAWRDTASVGLRTACLWARELGAVHCHQLHLHAQQLGLRLCQAASHMASEAAGHHSTSPHWTSADNASFTLRPGRVRWVLLRSSGWKENPACTLCVCLLFREAGK